MITGSMIFNAFTLLVVIFMVWRLFKIGKYVQMTEQQLCQLDQRHHPSREDAHINTSIDEILNVLRIELMITDIYIGMFHNGGSFVNGERMKKFSIPYGKAASTVKELVRWRIKDKFISHWSQLFDELFVSGEYFCPDIEESRDEGFKRDMRCYGFKASYMFLMRQADISQTPAGFLSLNYDKTKTLSREDRDKIKEVIPKLLQLINLKGIDHRVNVLNKRKEYLIK